MIRTDGAAAPSSRVKAGAAAAPAGVIDGS
jgi:hypothetical protein